MDQYIAKPIIIPELEKVLKACMPNWAAVPKVPCLNISSNMNADQGPQARS